jgi:hypothetical protein
MVRAVPRARIFDVGTYARAGWRTASSWRPGPQLWAGLSRNGSGLMVQTLWGCLGVGDTRPHIVRTRAHVQLPCQMARRGRALIPRGRSRSIATPCSGLGTLGSGFICCHPHPPLSCANRQQLRRHGLRMGMRVMRAKDDTCGFGWPDDTCTCPFPTYPRSVETGLLI